MKTDELTEAFHVINAMSLQVLRMEVTKVVMSYQPIENDHSRRIEMCSSLLPSLLTLQANERQDQEDQDLVTTNSASIACDDMDRNDFDDFNCDNFNGVTAIASETLVSLESLDVLAKQGVAHFNHVQRKAFHPIFFGKDVIVTSKSVCSESYILTTVWLLLSSLTLICFISWPSRAHRWMLLPLGCL